MAPKLDKLLKRVSTSDVVAQHSKIEKALEKITLTNQNDYAWSCNNHLETKYKLLPILDSAFPKCAEPHCFMTMLPPEKGDVWVCTEEKKHKEGFQHTRTDEERTKNVIPKCGVCDTNMKQLGKDQFDWEVNGIN